MLYMIKKNLLDEAKTYKLLIWSPRLQAGFNWQRLHKASFHICSAFDTTVLSYFFSAANSKDSSKL